VSNITSIVSPHNSPFTLLVLVLFSYINALRARRMSTKRSTNTASFSSPFKRYSKHFSKEDALKLDTRIYVVERQVLKSAWSKVIHVLTCFVHCLNIKWQKAGEALCCMGILAVPRTIRSIICYKEERTISQCVCFSGYFRLPDLYSLYLVCRVC
jgi:hypothetical protein